MKENLVHTRTCVCNINYHIVWTVKYRRKVLLQEIEQDLKQIAEETARKKGFVLHMLEVGEADHVHCFISALPTMTITEIVKYLKGITGRLLLYRHPELKEKLWKGELWNHSYYVETIGSISEDTIRRYIEKQQKAY